VRAGTIAGIVAGLAVVWVGYNEGGPFGAALAGAIVAGVALLVVRVSAIPSPKRRSLLVPPREPAETASGRIPRLERIGWVLGWASVGGRHFEYGARRLLRELLAQRLATRRRIDLQAEPAAARAVVGERLWPLVDPDISYADAESGVDIRLLDEFATMLEEL
jgi:hypothetical protein